MAFKRGHSGEHPTGCPSCITAAEKKRMPWHKSYHDILAHETYGKQIAAKHNAALRRGLRAGHVKF